MACPKCNDVAFIPETAEALRAVMNHEQASVTCANAKCGHVFVKFSDEDVRLNPPRFIGKPRKVTNPALYQTLAGFPAMGG